MEYILVASFFIGSDMFEHRIQYPSQAECMSSRAFNGQVLNRLTETVLTGYSLQCVPATDEEVALMNNEQLTREQPFRQE